MNLTKCSILLFFLSFTCNAFAQDVLIIPYKATSLTEEQRNANPNYLIYPAHLEGVEDINMVCYPITTDCVEYVDLGLSVKWATCNVGATSPEDYGDYFAWGETKSKEIYDWSMYEYCNGTYTTLTKYCTDATYGAIDNKTILEPIDDAATANWGSEWRIPTDNEWTELRENCTWIWTTQNGINGYQVTGINGNSIFLPAAGCRYSTQLNYTGSEGNYWSSLLNTSDSKYALFVYFNSSILSKGNGIRYYGQSIRPVTSGSTTTEFLTIVSYDTIYWESSYSFAGYEFSLAEYKTDIENGDINLVIEYRDKQNCIKHKLFLTLLSPYINVTLNNIQVIDQCADEGMVELLIDVEGLVDSILLQFPQDTIDSVYSGLYDVIVPMPADGHLVVPYPYIRAGKYNVLVSGYFHDTKVFTQEVSLTYLYPAAVLEQRWDDVICVLTDAYNGGYTFTAFQWYKDGQEIPGETHFYLTRPLESGSEYTALLTEIDGTQLMTCPLIVKKRAEISIEPSLVEKRQYLCCRVPDAGELLIYNLMGNLYFQASIQQGDNYFFAPTIAGMYIAKIILPDCKEMNVKILVR